MSNYCYISNLGKIPGWSKTHLTGCIGEIIGFHRILTDEETPYIHQYLMTKWAKPFAKCEVPNKAILPEYRTFSHMRYTTKMIPFKSGKIGELWLVWTGDVMPQSLSKIHHF